MKKIIMGMLLGGMTVSSWAACNYDLNGTPQGAVAFTSVVNQKATFSIASTATQLEYYAINSNFNPNATTLTGDIQLAQSGIVAFEFDSTVIPNDLPGTEGVMQGYTFMGLDANDKSHGLSISYSNNTSVQNYKRAIIFLQTGPDPSTGRQSILSTDVKPYSANSIQNIGIYINQNSNQYGLIINGVNQGYIGSFSNQIKKGIFQLSASTYNVPTTSSNIGTPLTLELITDHNKMKNTYPSGATDICGNTL